jgi:hypothetical protein
MEYTELPDRTRQALTGRPPDESEIVETLNHFGPVDPHPGDAEGQVEVLAVSNSPVTSWTHRDRFSRKSRGVVLMNDIPKFVVSPYAWITKGCVRDEISRSIVEEYSYPAATRAVTLWGYESKTHHRESYSDAAKYGPNSPDVRAGYIDGGHFCSI